MGAEEPRGLCRPVVILSHCNKANECGGQDSCTHRYLLTKGPWSLRGGREQSNSSRERGEVRREMKQGRGNERLSAQRP